MTLLVAIALAICLIAGVWILLRAARLRRSAGGPCPKCRTTNRPDARFCACCGSALAAPQAPTKGEAHV
jgi:hypothetical protein